jgi:hypothetical protein
VPHGLAAKNTQFFEAVLVLVEAVGIPEGRPGISIFIPPFAARSTPFRSPLNRKFRQDRLTAVTFGPWLSWRFPPDRNHTHRRGRC